nr:AlpA family phage regulatory protein [Aquitalea denitrificans]
MTGLPRSTIYLYMKQKVFPSQVKLGVRSVGWLEDEISSWIEERKCGRA